MVHDTDGTYRQDGSASFCPALSGDPYDAPGAKFLAQVQWLGTAVIDARWVDRYEPPDVRLWTVAGCLLPSLRKSNVSEPDALWTNLQWSPEFRSADNPGRGCKRSPV